MNAVNPHTRAAWGWLDSDGDGLVDVRDTFPRSEIEARVEAGGMLRLDGVITDVPAPVRSPSPANTPFSVNRIRTLRYRFADIPNSPWIERALSGETRGREVIELALGFLPAGRHRIGLRAVNSVGNVEKTPREITVESSVSVANATPHVSIEIDRTVGWTSSDFELMATVFDPDGDPLAVAFDTDGDGVFEREGPQASVRFEEPGIHIVRVEARDPRGGAAEAAARLHVLSENAPPRVTIACVGSPVVGSDTPIVSAHVASASDPEGGALEYRWIRERLDVLDPELVATEFSSEGDSIEMTLATPANIETTPIGLLASPELEGAVISHAIALGGDLVALGLGPRGLAIIELADDSATLVSRVDLETAARELCRDGACLYVLGRERLTIVDLSDPRRPVEIPQRRARGGKHRDTVGYEERISEKGPSRFLFTLPTDEPIEDLQPQVSIEHPDPSQPRISLEPPPSSGLEPVVLRDREADTGGRRRYKFRRKTHAALDELVGVLASDHWHRIVEDLEPDGVEGRFLKGKVKVRTRHRAARTIAGATRILGALDGDHVIVAGESVQILDATRPERIRQRARIKMSWVRSGAIVDGHLLVVGFGSKPTRKGEPAVGGASLFAHDVSEPRKPRLLREETGVELEGFAVVGSRFCFARASDSRGVGSISHTRFGDIAAFVSGGDFELGTFPGRIVPSAFGDDASLWNLASKGEKLDRLQKLDVSDPARVSIARSFSLRPPRITRETQALVRIDESRVLLVGSTGGARLANLESTSTSTTSQVYRLTLEARDASGAIGRAEQTIHVVPYGHAPVIESVEVVAGMTAADTWTFGLTSSDADAGEAWDPHAFFRVDTDGDGVFDAPWQDAVPGGVTRFEHEFPAPGEYLLEFELRDGLHASDRASITVHVEPLPLE